MSNLFNIQKNRVERPIRIHPPIKKKEAFTLKIDSNPSDVVALKIDNNPTMMHLGEKTVIKRRQVSGARSHIHTSVCVCVNINVSVCTLRREPMSSNLHKSLDYSLGKFSHRKSDEVMRE